VNKIFLEIIGNGLYLCCINKKINIQAQVQKWGNSLAIRIPKSFAKQINIDQGLYLDLSTIDGKLVAEPIAEEYSLQELLNKVTNENIHKEIEAGVPAGKEIW